MTASIDNKIRGYIEHWRAEAGITTNTSLAKLSGVPLSTLNGFIRGESPGSDGTWRKLAEALDKDWQDIRYGPDRWKFLDGAKVKEVREAKGLYIRDMAARLSITERAWEAAEDSVFKVDTEALARIAGELDVPPEILVADDGHLDIAIRDAKFENATIGMNNGVIMVTPQEQPVEREYIVTQPGATDKDLRMEIISIVHDLTGEHLKHLHYNAIAALKCSRVEQKNIAGAS